MKILLIYPEMQDTFWGFKHNLRFVSERAAFQPLGVLSIAAMIPSNWELRLVDTNVERLKDKHLHWADYVMISGIIMHKESVNGIVERCLKLSKTVMAGGPLFTTGYAAFPQIRDFVLGEAEEIMPRLIEDMNADTQRHCYQAAGRPDITRVPVPRYDHIDFWGIVDIGGLVSGRIAYWRLFCSTLLRQPRQLRNAIELAIIGCHFPRVASHL